MRNRSRISRVSGHGLATLLLIAVLAAGCGSGSEPAATGQAGGEAANEPGDAAPVGGGASASATVASDAGLGFLTDRQLTLPQFAAGDDGVLLVSWREPTDGRGGDLMLARRNASGVFEESVRINDVAGSVGGGSLDEGRPAIAVAGDHVAVAWTARGGDIRAAVSNDGGRTFAPSLNLNSDEGAGAYRGFVDIALDATGVAHAAWIDGRFAPRGAEEPAELFYARIADGQVTEINLTEHQEDSICGCCRIDVAARDDGGLTIAFRNTGDGYRDIWRIEAEADGTFGEPARLGPPMWELNGCPVIGPLNVGEATLWAEASTGKRRILAATGTDGAFEVVIEDDEQWAIERPPRLVLGGAHDGEALLLLPGRPAGKLLRGAGRQWRVVGEDAPRWAMSAALIDDRLVLIGELEGRLQVATFPLES